MKANSFLKYVVAWIGLLVPQALTGLDTIKLPGVVEDVVAGGGGKFLVLRCNQIKEVHVFDVENEKLIGKIPFTGERTNIAANFNKIILVDNDSRTISRWNIATQAKEKESTYPKGFDLYMVVMGSNTFGPAYSATSREVRQIDVDTLQVKKLSILPGDELKYPMSTNAKISRNGSTVVLPWSVTYQTLLPSNGLVAAPLVSMNGGESSVSSDGQSIFIQNYGIYDSELNVIEKIDRKVLSKFLLVAAADGPFYLRHPLASRINLDPMQNVTEIYSIGGKKPLGSVTGLNPVKKTLDRKNRGFATHKKIWFFSKLNKVIQFNEERDELIVTDIPLKQMVTKENPPFLEIDSVPKVKVKAGDNYVYRLGVHASLKQKLRYRLVFGPNGMTVDNKGVVRWSPSKSSARHNHVIIEVSGNEGRTATQSFDVAVEGSSPALPKIESNLNSEKATKVFPVKIDGESENVKLLSSFSTVKVGGGGRYLCLKMFALRRIAIFDVCEKKIIGMVPAEAESLFVAGRSKLVVFDSSSKKIFRYRLADQKLESIGTYPGNSIDLAAMGSDSNGPILVGMQTGDVRIAEMNYSFIDLASLRSFTTSGLSLSHRTSPRTAKAIHASAKGDHFSIRGLGPFKLKGRQIIGKKSSSYASLLPSSDGRYFVGLGIYDIEMNRLDNETQARFIGIPSVTGNFFLRFGIERMTSTERRLTPTPKLYVFGDNRPIADGPKMSAPRSPEIDNDVFFIPEAEAIVAASKYRKSLIYYPFKQTSVLKNSQVKFLNVDSSPPTEATKGKLFEYPVKVSSQSTDLRFSIDLGPKDMQIDKQGKITWTPNQTEIVVVIVNIETGDGLQTYHKFKLTVKQP